MKKNLQANNGRKIKNVIYFYDFLFFKIKKHSCIRVLFTLRGDHVFDQRFQVVGKNNKSMGNISNLPASISKMKMILEKPE